MGRPGDGALTRAKHLVGAGPDHGGAERGVAEGIILALATSYPVKR
ncbi:MAG: hypothetical protein J2P45_21630 [Candidatus Dormibacteraeota bacterium]|nr:hypothetical protein [Candidatus Dormibacteraeota bacterium]